VIDAQDADFARFGVWQDGNEHGVSEAGEFNSLGALGITSIELTSDGQSYVTANGDVLVMGEAGFVRGGATFALADAVFATAPIDRRTAEVTVAAAAAGALLAPELAAASDAKTAADERFESTPSTIHSGEIAVDFGAFGGDGTPAKLSYLFEDGAPRQEDGAAEFHRSDKTVTTDSLGPVENANGDAVATGSGSETVANFSGSSGLMFQATGGEALMEALLINATAGAASKQTQDVASVRGALAEVADGAAVDAIVSHFADAGSSPIPAEMTNNALLEALDIRLDFAGNGAPVPDVVDDAAQLAAAVQA
jgi:hypothetical protein